MIKAQIGLHPLQFSILPLHLPELTKQLGIHARILLFPVVKSGPIDLQLPTDLITSLPASYALMAPVIWLSVNFDFFMIYSI
jgi:hypothetical protein